MERLYDAQMTEGTAFFFVFLFRESLDLDHYH